MFDWILAYPVSAACFAVVLFCLWHSLYFKKDFFSPARVYVFTQCLTLGIAYFQLYPEMSDFKLKTWFIWLGAIIAFCAGSFLARLIAKQKNCATEVGKIQYPSDYNWGLHLVLSLIPFMLFLVGIYGIIQTAGKLLVFTGNAAQWMTKNTDYGYYSVLFSSGPLCVLLYATASFKKFNPHKNYRLIARGMVLFTIVLNLLAYPNRGTLFFNIGIIIILFNFLHKKISAIWLLVCLCLGVGAFLGISSIRDQYGSGSMESLAADAVMEIPYKYVANNYWNFDYAVNPPPDREFHPPTYGIDAFYGMFEFLQISGSFRYSYRWDGLFNERIEKVGGYNTASYLWEVYKDWRMPGVFLLPFFVGLALTILYFKLALHFTPRQVMFYSMFLYFVGWCFFTPGYKQGIYWAWAVILFAISTICMGSFLPRNFSRFNKVHEQGETQKNIAR